MGLAPGRPGSPPGATSRPGRAARSQGYRSPDGRLAVAIDARRLQDRPLGGVGRLLANILPGLAAEVDLELLTDARRPPAPSQLPQHRLPSWGSAREAAWLQLAAPRWLGGFPGLFHCPCYGLPYRQPVPMVVSIHDLTFEDHGEWFAPAQRVAFRAQARHGARTARRVLTGSRHVAESIVQRYGVDPERVVVAPLGVDPCFAPDPDPALVDQVLSELGVRTPYVVAFGGAPRRGLDVALGAWRQLGGDASLVVVGRELPAPEPGLVAAGPLDDRRLALVLAGAAALCYPTAYEGFGLPALEAAACGTPVVCGPVGALPEVLGPAAAWCDQASVASVAGALVSVLGDPPRAAELRAAGLARARARGWERATAVTLDAYRAASGD